jgi:hypothetical protein
VPFEISTPPVIGDFLKVLQLEDNGLPILTEGTLQSVGISPNLLPGQSFLTYRVKASMQSASSSYTLPVLHGRQLAGVLISYNSKDQLCDVVSTDILARFINESSEGIWRFPQPRCHRPHRGRSFRQWLKLRDDQGGSICAASARAARRIAPVCSRATCCSPRTASPSTAAATINIRTTAASRGGTCPRREIQR